MAAKDPSRALMTRSATRTLPGPGSSSMMEPAIVRFARGFCIGALIAVVFLAVNGTFTLAWSIIWGTEQ